VGVTRASIFSASTPSSRQWSPNMSDEEIWRLNRGGHDPRKVYAAYAAAVSHKGQPTVISGEDREGLRPSQGRRGADDRPPAEETLRGGPARVPRPLSTSRSRDQDLDSLPFRKPEEADGRGALPARAPRGARGLPCRAGAAARRRSPYPARGVSPRSSRDRRARDLHHHGVRARAHHPAQGQEHRSQYRADRAG